MSETQAQAPLNDREKALLVRLFADPTNYPQTLKTWIVSFLEGSDVDLPMNAIHGLLDQLDNAKGQRDFKLTVGQGFRVLDHQGAPIFVVDEDGDLHGKTGKTITFDQ